MCKKQQLINRPLTQEEREKNMRDNILGALNIQEGIMKDTYKYLDMLPEIEAIAEFVKEDPSSTESYYYSIGFIAGYDHRINKFWHDATVEPELNEFFVYCDENNQYETDCFYKKQNWKVYVAENNLERWAYMKDLIPNKEKQL